MGFVAAAMERFGRTKEDIMWRMSYAELMIMTRDVTRYVSAEEMKERKRLERPESFDMEYFQTKLSR